MDSLSSEAENTVKRCDWIVMPPIYMGYTGVIEKTEINSFDEFKAAAKNGGMIKIGEDMDFTSNVIVPQGKSLVANLNGKALKNNNDLWGESKYQWSLFSVQGGTLVLEGEGDVIAKENDCYPVDVQDGGHLVIKGGHYNGNIHAVYVYEGTAEIKGGVFEVQQKYSDASKADEFVLNCYDANRKNGTAKIVVTGGTFIGFNPADCYAEGAHTNFLAEGYSSVLVSTAPMTYEVVKSSDVSTNADLLQALKREGSVIGVKQDITISSSTTVETPVKVVLSDGAKITADQKRVSALKVSGGSKTVNGTLDLYGYGTITGPSNKTSGYPKTAAVVCEKGNLNIYGNITFDGGSGNETNNAVCVAGGSTNIYGGYFHTGLDKNVKPNACVLVDAYTRPSVCRAQVNIYGGVFEAENPKYLLNIQDDVRDLCTLKVYGGTFVGFNPADNGSEGEHTNFVAEGYKSEKTTYNGKEAWEVVKE